MLTQLALGTFALLLTVAIAGVFVLVATETVLRKGRWLIRRPHAPKFTVAMVLIVLWTQLAVTLSVLVWALMFRALGIFETMEPAIYFALVAFTTLGFGDVLLEEDWRLLSGLAASNGLLLFGLFTAFLVEMLRRIRTEQLSGLADPD